MSRFVAKMPDTHLTSRYRSIRSSSIFLYGWSEEFDAAILLPEFADVAKRAGAEVHLVGFTPTDGELKYLRPKNFEKHLAARSLAKLAHISMLSLLDKSDKQSEVFCASLDQDQSSGKICTLILTQGGEEFRHSLINEFLRMMLNYITPLYGYTVDLPLSSAPGYFAHGLLSPSLNAETEAGAWQQAHSPLYGVMEHKRGRFRHVFRTNILSSAHVENRVEGKEFLTWAAEGGHGKLERWKERVWVWTVPEEQRIPCARALQRNGLLIAPDGFENELLG